MSHSQDAHKPVFRFRNPFRVIFPKGSNTSSKILALLNDFENKLAGRIEKLQPVGNEDALQLSWLICAMKQLCEAHADVKTLIQNLDLPASNWKGKWIKMHLDSSAKLLDISNSFTSHIRELEQGHHDLLFALHCLGGTTPEAYVNACSSLDKWRHRVSSNSPLLDQCFATMDGLTSQALELSKGSNSKEEALIRVMYGVMVVTLFVCGVFIASFSGGCSSKKLKDFQVADRYLWAKAFAGLQAHVNAEIKKVFTRGRANALKELEAIDAGARKLYTILREGEPVEADVLMNATSNIKKSFEEYSRGLPLLMKEVNKFFDALLAERNSWLLTQ